MRLCTVLLLWLMTAAAQAETYPIQPKIKHIELNAFTTFNIELIPDLGTRFVFPFVLDESDDLIPFTLDVTNPMFKTTRHPGRNFFTVEIDPPAEGGAVPNYLSNMFISAGGYNLTIVLTATNDLKKHVSDYVFDLTPGAREDLIQEAIKKRTRTLEASYKDKQTELIGRAESIALNKMGQLALGGSDKKSIKEEVMLDLPTGERVTFYLKKMLTFGDKFHIFQYEITNETVDVLRVTDVSLFAMDKNGMTQKIQSGNLIKPRIDIDETIGGAVSTDAIQIRRGANLKMVVATSQGNLEVLW